MLLLACWLSILINRRQAVAREGSLGANRAPLHRTALPLSPQSPHATTVTPAAATWESRWKKSSWKEPEGAAGEFKLSAGKWYGDEEMDKGIQTAIDSRFSTIYSELPQTLDTTGKDLVVQVGTALALDPRKRDQLGLQAGCPPTHTLSFPPYLHSPAVLREARAGPGLRWWLLEACP